MDAFHSLWTKPSADRGKEFSLSEFETVCTVLSALMWRRLNGNIFLICDRTALDYLDKRGLLPIWNKALPVLEDIPSSVDPKTYWAAGKLFALREFSSPVVGMDTDFIVWKKIEFSSNICAIHSEAISSDAYPELPDFREFAHDLSFKVQPCNTAFFYINDNEFLKLYTKKSIEFMSSYNPSGNPLSYMLFAEQRLFSMCAESLGKSVFKLSNLNELFSKKNETFTHLWGYKDILRKAPALQKSFCEKGIKRIIRDFPEFSYLFPEHRL